MRKLAFDSSLVPWCATPSDAVAAVADLSPELAVQRKAEGAKIGSGGAVDVHAGVRALIGEATAG